MSNESPKLSIIINYNQIKFEFEGNPNEVAIATTNFLLKNVPEIDLAHKISVNFSAKDLIDRFHKVIKITPEGPRVWTGEIKMSDKDIVALQLVAVKIGFETGNNSSDNTTIQEIQSVTGLKTKSLSSRISELLKSGYVLREKNDDGAKYKITTQGIDWLYQNLSKKNIISK